MKITFLIDTNKHVIWFKKNSLYILHVQITNHQKIIIFSNMCRYVKDILIEMMDDWCKMKSPEELMVINNHVKFSHKFCFNAVIAYNLTILMFPTAALRTYFNGSVENRLLPLMAIFPFSQKISPNYEILYFAQTVLLILAGNLYCVTDSSYVAMVIIFNNKHIIHYCYTRAKNSRMAPIRPR